MLASVLINNYNYADYLEECIQSVLDQTYEDIEIIVYDDGSTDNSLDVLSQFSNIKVILKENYGKSHNLNQMNAVYQAYQQSKGDYIFLLDSDDLFKEDKIEKIISAFKSHPHVEAIQHSLEEVNKYSESLHSIVPVLKDVTNYKEYIYTTESLFHLFSTTSALAFRRSFLQRVLPLKEDELSYIWMDTRLMQLATVHSQIFTIREPLTYYRKHGKNAWSSLGDLDVHDKYTLQLYEFFNSVAVENNLPRLKYSVNNFLENTFFYNNTDVKKCDEFISNNEYWIWGAGEAGQSVCHALRKQQGELLGFIDSDLRKQNQLIMDRKIYAPEDVYYKKNIKIIVSPYHAYDAIKKVLKNKEISEGLQFIDPFIRKE
ncbi:glycosyltransferase [Paenibacillus endoradicis]|uniref:glycosyltransferase n=1 Tax=Paenibacillus endoradicis TaxID=2972487 RepID=UPI002159572B|nr:glycosyltransferase [Paenibacillus endoradicis]MCR8660522.1 glycosyltransferase [Paenibacillus endoradicis]